MSDELNKNTNYSRSFDSKTSQMMQDRSEKILSPGQKISDFQKEISVPKANEFKVDDEERYEPTKIKKNRFGPFQSLFDLFTIRGKKDEKKDEVKKKEEPPQSFDGMTIQDILAPIDMEIDFNTVQIGDTYYRTFFVSGYPRFVGPNWLSPIINFEHSLRISSFYYPVDSKIILDKLKQKIGEMEATLYSQMEGRKVVDPSIKVALTDAQKLQDSIAEGTEKFFHFGLYVTISTKNKDELEKVSKNVVSTLAAINVTAKSATLQQEQGLISTQPLGLDKLYITRNMDTTSLATTFPFVTSELTMDHGVMYGINQHNKSLVIFDRFEMENANAVIFAKSGAGKSYFVKLEAVRSLMLGSEIIIIDPEREYEALCAAVGGAYVSYSQDTGQKMNPFELSGLGEEDDDELRMKLLSLQGFFRILFGGLGNVETAILDRALLLTYREKGITLDPATQRNATPPLLEDLYKVLKGMAETEAHEMARRLERYIMGSGAGIFNEASSVELNNPFTVFSIRDLQEELRPMAMYLMLDYIWTRVRKDRRRRIMIVDEAWYMMQNEDSARFMYSIAKRARKYYLGLSTITQDVDDFLKNDMGRAIISNSAIQMLMKQSPSAIDKVQKVFNLSEGEKNFLLNADQGQGLFFAGSNHVAIQVVSSNAEHELITSDPRDLEKRKNEGTELGSRPIEELADLFEPPAMQTPIKASVSTDERDIIKRAIERRKSDVRQIIQERRDYRQQMIESANQTQSPQNSTFLENAPQSLTDHIVAQRKALQDGRAHITPQGIIGDGQSDQPNEQSNSPSQPN